MSERGGQLVKNTAILAVGNIGSRIIKFFLLPMFAVFLPKQDVGLYDLIFTAVLLVEPLATLKVVDAVYRRLVSSDGEMDELIWTGAIFSFVVLVVVVGLFLVFFPSSLFQYKWEAAAFLAGKVFYSYFSEVIRGYRRNSQYAIGGVILAITILILSLAALFLSRDKLSALLYATATAHFLVGLYFMRVCGFLSSKPVFIVATLAPMLAYSVPLIPSAINWWAMLLSSRLLVTEALGLEQNAIIAIAMTFPSIVVVLGQIFSMAWQESSFLNIEAKDRDRYFSSVYDKYIRLQFFVCTVCFLVSGLVYQFFFPTGYSESWQLSYFFFWGALFYNLSTFLAVGYTGTYNTSGASYTAVAGTVVNVVSTWLLLPLIELWAAPVGFFLGLLGLWLIRSIHTRKYFHLQIDLRVISSGIFAFSLAGICLLVDSIFFKIAISAASLGVLVLGNLEALKNILATANRGFFGR